MNRDDYRNPDLRVTGDPLWVQLLDRFPDENDVGEPYEDFPMPSRRSRTAIEAPAVPPGVPSFAQRGTAPALTD